MIEHLLGATPAHLRIEFVEADGAPCYSVLPYDIYVVGDGTAILRGESIDVGFSASRMLIRDAPFFDECRSANADASALNRCLIEWAQNNSCIAPLCCPGGGDGDSLACEAE